MESEYFTNTTDNPNIEVINTQASEDFFKNTQFISNDFNNMTDNELKYNLFQLQKPNDIIMQSKDNYFELVDEYIPKKTNLYKIMLKLKTNLIEVKNEIDYSAKCYNDLSPIISELDTSPYSYNAINQIVTSKKTVDAFINYNLLNSKDEEDKDDTEANQYSLNNKLSNKTDNNTTTQDKIVYSSYERYNRLSNNLLSQVKQLENDLINGEEEKAKIEYAVIMKKVSKIAEINKTIAELEDRITYMEKSIGEWELHKNYDNISKFLLNLVYYNEELIENSDYKIRHEALKTIDSILNEFNIQFKEGIKYARLYSQINDYYQIFETSTNFKSVFEYIQMRLKTIKDICIMMNNLNHSFSLLNEKIENNEKNYNLLKANFNTTIVLFKDLEITLKEVNEIDKEINAKINNK